jgi:hypothetical protein
VVRHAGVESRGAVGLAASADSPAEFHDGAPGRTVGRGSRGNDAVWRGRT